MVSTLIKLTIVLLFINLGLYLGMNFAISAEGEELQQEFKFHLEGDLLQKIAGDSIQNVARSTKDNFTDYEFNVSKDWTTFPEEQSGSAFGTDIVSFIDVIKMIVPFLRTLFNIAVSPITLFATYRLPALLAALIGLPYLIIFIITVFSFLRGVGD